MAADLGICFCCRMTHAQRKSECCAPTGVKPGSALRGPAWARDKGQALSLLIVRLTNCIGSVEPRSLVRD